MKRTKLLAILGAAVLTVGVVGVAMALELKEAHQGLTVSWDSEGNPVLPDGFEDSTECPGDAEPGEGEVTFHFVQSGNDVDPGEAGTNLLDVDFDDEADVNDVPSDSSSENNVDWFVKVDASDGEVTLVSAESDLSGGELRVSHICVGDAPGDEPTPTPDEPTPTPTFTGGGGALTDPPTDTIGGNGTSSPADGAWLLVVALGVLLASIVVLTPAKAQSRR